MKEGEQQNFMNFCWIVTAAAAPGTKGVKILARLGQRASAGGNIEQFNNELPTPHCIEVQNTCVQNQDYSTG